MICVLSQKNYKLDDNECRLINLDNKTTSEINNTLDKMSSNDTIVILPTGAEIPKKGIMRIVDKYNENSGVMSFQPEQINNEFYNTTILKYDDSDIVVLKKSYIRRQLRALSHTFDYNKVKRAILKISCVDGQIYTSIDREPKVPEMVLTKPPVIDVSPLPIKKHSVVTKVDKITYVQDNKNCCSVKVNMNIKDMLFTRAILDRQQFHNVYVSKNFKESSYSIKDVVLLNTLFDMLFCKPYYIKSEDDTFLSRTLMEFKTLDNFIMNKPHLSDILCDGQKLDIGEYITISTEVSEECADIIDYRFIETIISKPFTKKYKIVLLGKRNETYEKLKDIEGIIDKTTNTNNLQIYKQNCMYMRDAEWNIIVGENDMSATALSVGRCIVYHNNQGFYPHVFDKDHKYAGIHLYADATLFFEKITDLTKKGKPIHSICVNMGVGDLILIKSMLDFTKDRFSKVKISLNTPLFDSIRSKDYKNGFIKDYFEMLFTPPFYEITKNLKQQKREDSMLYSLDKIKTVLPQHLRDLMCDGTPLDIDEPYVTINTKIRCLDKSSYDGIKNDFFRILKDISTRYKIVILGEKKLPNWKEINVMFKDIYLMYDDIIKNISKERIVDLTFETVENGSVSNIKQDCLIMKNAKNNIFMGIAGNWCLCQSCGNSISYFKIYNDHQLEYTWTKSSTYITNDGGKYLTWLERV